MKKAELREKLDAIGQSIARKRDESVKERKKSGIEEIWMNCEEAYLGIDDANRHEFASAKWAKATNTEGPITTNDVTNDDTRSTAFVRLTSRYVDFAAAKLSEIVLPIDDKAFSFEPTPVPDMVMAQLEEQAGPEAKDKILQQAAEAAAAAEERIYDWMVECGHQTEMRKVITDAARIGTGVLKGPVPDKRKEQAIIKKDGVVALEIKEKIVPVTKWVDVWNLFPAPGCGENIHDGDYLFERDYMSEKKVKNLRGGKWNKEQINKVLREGPGKKYEDGGPRSEHDINKHRYEVWHYYGHLSKEDLEAAGVEAEDGAYAIVTLINDSVVRCVLNPLDSGRFPYHVFPWSRRAGHWAGVGVGEQVFMPQRMVNASTRAVLENAGVSAGVQIVLDQGLVEPADKQWSITRNKIWLKAADSVIDDVRKAFHIFEIPNIQAQLMPIIEYGLRLAEEHSSIPLVSMGQYAENGSPQTFGQAELQNSNANTLLRDKGNTIDDCITEPLVGQFYEWLLLDPDVPAEEKGDFKVNAHGTVAMVERAIQEMTIIQALNMAVNPAFGADPKKTYALWLKTKRIDPREVQYSDEEMEQMSQQQGQPDPRIEAANINAQARVQAAQINAQAGVQKEQMRSQVVIQRMITETDRDAEFVQEQRERTRTNAQQRMAELSLKRELALLDYANKRNISVDTLRTKLASDTAKLKVQKELAAMSAPGQVITPPTEPPGRAPAGQAYQR